MNGPMKQEQPATEGEIVSNEPIERTYHAHPGGHELAFDPLKDLNLPGSYQEVMERLGKLGGDRSAETLN